jgi:ATP-dependent helicase/nuclease subunit B
MSTLDTLWNKLRRQATIITPQQPLANWLAYRYHTHQAQQNLCAWQTPDILSLTVWLTRHWLQTPDSRIVLTQSAEQLIWQQIIQQHTSQPGVDLLHLSRMASHAWAQWHHWQLPVTARDCKVTVDAQAFWQWQTAFRQHCAEHRCISLPELADALLPYLPQLALPDTIIFVCFDNPSAQLESLLTHLRQSGIHVELFDHRQPEAAIQATAFASEAEEIQAMLTWASQQPDESSVGCIVPELNQLRDKLIHAWQDIDTDNQTALSIPQPLNDYPLIYTALTSLQLLMPVIPSKTLGRLLRSPFIADGHTDLLTYSQIDQAIQASGVTEWTLTELHDFLAAFACSSLREALQNIQQIPIPQTAPANHWSALFWQCLTSLGWPGQRPLTTQETQLNEQLQQVFQAFGSLAQVLQPLSLDDALACLTQLTTERLWPTAHIDASVTLLDIQQATGMLFDKLWVMGMDDESWPPPATPSPLLPHHLQRHHHLPGACAADQLTMARQLTHRWRHSCRQLHISFTQIKEDKHHQLSQLYNDISPTPYHSLAPAPDFAGHAAILERLTDVRGLPLQSGDTIAGGSFILKEQASCPFRAFALFRLQAIGRALPTLGISPLEHGSLVHRVLDDFWRQTKNQRQLLAYSEQTLTDMLEQCIERALTTLDNKQQHTLFNSLEKIRLRRLLTRWLDIEKQRPPFSVVAIEQLQTIDLAGLSLRIRCDRIDELADGGQFMIDYKTGQPSISDWFGERPLEPQLPLYSLYYSAINSIGFAQLRPNELCFKGISQSDTEIAGIKLSEQSAGNAQWQELQQQWREEFSKLSQAFQQGIALVDPKADACKTCDLQSLCRIQDIADDNHDN